MGMTMTCMSQYQIRTQPLANAPAILQTNGFCRGGADHRNGTR